jgi:hypothetical protein
MLHEQKIAPLKVANVDFLVTSQIERCPHTMMPRELVMNAIEAATKDKSGRGRIEIRAKELPQFPGVRKLAFWNNGPGMNSAQLSHICDIAASLKNMSLEANFGMGAKVSALGVNHLGMRYRSCTGGIVHQVVIGRSGEVYGKLCFLVEDTWETVLDVTERIREEGEYPLDKDWTEVVLLGNSADQDTVANPYGANTKPPRQWLTDALYYRFYKIPENVELWFGPGVHPKDGNRQFKTIRDRYGAFGQTETVEIGDGVRVHYLFDPPCGSSPNDNMSYSGALCTTPASAAVIFRGEMYDVRRSSSWAAIAPEFGIPFGSKHISVHVELPDNYSVLPEAYRRFLQVCGDDKHQVQVSEFADVVRDHRPEWLCEIITNLGPKPSVNAGAIEKELQELLNSLAVKALAPRITPDGDLSVIEGTGRGETPKGAGKLGPFPNPNPEPTKQPARYQESTHGVRRAKNAMLRETAPKIILISEDWQIEERGITGKAASFLQGTNELYINCKYSAVQDISNFLLKQFAFSVAELGETVREAAEKIATNVVTIRCGRTVVHAKAKLVGQLWTEDEVELASAPESLSVAADDWADVASAACHEMRKLLGLSARQARLSRSAA